MSIYEVIEVIESNNHVYDILKMCPYYFLKKWTVRTYHEGDLVISQGERFTHFYIIVEGQADIYMMSESGKKYSQAIYQQGDFIGEIEIFDDSASVCFVEALTPLKVLAIHVEDFLEWIRVDSHMSHYFNQTLAKYLYNLSKTAGMNGLYPLEYRLCNYLLQKAVPHEEHQWIVRQNRTKIGNRLAVTQRSVNRILHDWKEQSLIRIKSNYIILLDKQRLKEKKKVVKG